MNKNRFLIAVAAVAVLLSMFAAPLSAAAAPAPVAGGSGCAQFYTVARGDRLFRIALRFGTTVPALAALNGLANPNIIWVGQTLCLRAGAASGVTYVVARGDTLAGIGRHFGWSISFLASVNHIANLNRIYVGQKLFIPGH